MIKIKNWDETIAASCRWSEYAEDLVGDWSILWEDSEADYQGHATVLAYKQGQLRYLHWYYGSCSGCDAYEDMTPEAVQKEFKNNIMMDFKNVHSFCNWMKMLASTKDSKYDQIKEAFVAFFKDDSYLDNPEKLETKLEMVSLLKE